MEFILVRHTRCDVAAGTCYGRLDIPLAASAPTDIDATLALIPRVDCVVSSPAQRCSVLASALAQRDDCAVHIMEELQELDFGAWEGLRWDDIPRTQSDAWTADPWHRAPPRGETELELWARVTTAAESLMQLERSHRIAIVSHGGPLRLLRCALTQAAVSERWSLNLQQGEVVRIPCSGSH